MSSIYVADTDSMMSYFNKVFGVPQRLSRRARSIIGQALVTYPSNVKLSIPSIVFVEIFDNCFRKEETANRLRYEFYEVIRSSPNVEVKAIEQEVLENILKIRDELSDHDMHDKIVLASAMMLNCTLITTDGPIIDYIKKHNIVSFIN